MQLAVIKKKYDKTIMYVSLLLAEALVPDREMMRQLDEIARQSKEKLMAIQTDSIGRIRAKLQNIR